MKTRFLGVFVGKLQEHGFRLATGRDKNKESETAFERFLFQNQQKV
jgi:hypothetical protein